MFFSEMSGKNDVKKGNLHAEKESEDQREEEHEKDAECGEDLRENSSQEREACEKEQAGVYTPQQQQKEKKKKQRQPEVQSV